MRLRSLFTPDGETGEEDMEETFMRNQRLFAAGALGCLLAVASAGGVSAAGQAGPIPLDPAALDRVVAGATYGIAGEAQASGDGSMGSSSSANLSLTASTDGKGATASGSASAMGVGMGENPQATSRADVAVSGPFDRIYWKEIKRRFGGRYFLVDYSVFIVVAVTLPKAP